MAENYRHPQKLPCDLDCDVPEGLTLTAIPRPRHAWGDVLRCPHCEAAWLIVPDEKPE